MFLRFINKNVTESEDNATKSREKFILSNFECDNFYKLTVSIKCFNILGLQMILERIGRTIQR